MDNLIGQIVITVLCLGLAGWAFLRWRKKKSIWLLLAIVVLIVAAADSWLAVVNGIFLAVLGAALLLLGLWSKRGR